MRGNHHKQYRASVVTVRIDTNADQVAADAESVHNAMKKTRSSAKRKVHAEPMLEMDFSKGVRGKYVERYRAARVTVQLDPDVAPSFPDSASANEGLRALLRLRRGETAEPT